MNEPLVLAMTTWPALLAAGLAGSLHCVGMCGPILAGFSQLPGTGGRPATLRSDFLAYHAGRIWTYALLGFGAGSFGARLREEAVRLGWQRPLSILFAALVLATALLLLVTFRTGRFEAFLRRCGAGAFATTRLAAIARAPGFGARLLLGAVMGFLPCGLVYAMLATVATFPSPAHAALGMLVFGLGTVPSLSVVLLLGRSIAPWVRRRGTPLVAAMLLVAGGTMLWRALTPPADHAAHAGVQRAGP
jgi:sulfite exporter TauE/SafE